MNRRPIGLCVCLLVASLSASVSAGEGEPGIEDEFAALVAEVHQLVEVLSRQVRAAEADRSLERVAVVTRLLDIRVRQQANLQDELRSIDSQEERILGYIASNEIRVENLDRQIAIAIDEAKKIELQSKQSEIRQYMNNQRNQLERLQHRRSEVQSRIAGTERRVREVEDLVQDWLAESGGRGN